MKTSDFKTRTEIIERSFPGPENHWVLGLDIGYSAVKGMSPNKIFCFPAYARPIPEGRVVLKEPDETDIRYRDSSGSWVVGNLAYDEISHLDNADSENELFGRIRYYSPLFKVIARTGIALGLMKNSFGKPAGKKIVIQAGLPPKYETDAPVVKEVLSGEHEFELKLGKGPWHRFKFTLEENDINIMPQPLGSLISASVDSFGRQLPSARNYFSSRVIIFDPGFGTTDDYTIHKGNVVSSETFPDLGMKEVFSRTCRDIKKAFNVTLSLPEFQNHLDSGTIKLLNKRAMKTEIRSFQDILLKNSRAVCNDTIERMKSIHDYFYEYDYIIATGGTYDAWASVFNETFKDMKDLQVISANVNDTSLSNVYSNVRGYYFYLVNRIGSKA